MIKIISYTIQAISLTASIAAIFMPNIEKSIGIIMILFTLLLCLLYQLYLCKRCSAKLKIKYKDLDSKHKALASLLEEKLKLINYYEIAYSQTELLLAIAGTNVKNLKFKYLAESIQFLFNKTTK